MVDRVEAVVEHRLLGLLEALGQQAVVFLALELERDQHALGERSGALLQLTVLGGQTDVQAYLPVRAKCIGEGSFGRALESRTAAGSRTG